jgi:hypothetical protein
MSTADATGFNFTVEDTEVDAPKMERAPGTGRKATPNPLQDIVNRLVPDSGKAIPLTIPGKASMDTEDGNPNLRKCRRLLSEAALKYSNPELPNVDKITVRWDFKPSEDGKTVKVLVWAIERIVRGTNASADDDNTVEAAK